MPDELSPEAAEAIHKAKNAAEAVEISREVQMAKVVEETAARTKEALLEGLKEVFGDSDNPQQMKILVRRIPILCTNVDAMHKSIEKIESNITWGVRTLIGAVVVGIIYMAFHIHGV